VEGSEFVLSCRIDLQEERIQTSAGDDGPAQPIIETEMVMISVVAHRRTQALSKLLNEKNSERSWQVEIIFFELMFERLFIELALEFS
jgi:hypothetical protein